jgi:diguanylate cyclase (GGDEF)-like protein
MFWAEVTLTASHIGGEGRVLAVFRDITDRKEIERRLQYLSNHDSLTGLYNRMHFEAEFKRLIKRKKYPLSVIVADLDGLKQINDTEGHASGDELIRLAADTLQKALRAEDIVARVGGDEFAVLITDADEAVVATAIERIREEEARSNSSRKKFQIRFSLGGATAAMAKQTDELFHNADLRMYANKAARKQQLDQ